MARKPLPSPSEGKRSTRSPDGRFARGGPGGPGRPSGSKSKGPVITGARSASAGAEAAAVANGTPPPTDLAVKTTSIRAALENVDLHYADAYLKAVVAGLNAAPPKSAPYIELVTRYRVGKPPDSGDSDRRPLVFWLGKGPPGGYDPLALPPPGQAEPPREVIDVAPSLPRPARRAASPAPATPMSSEDPDELVPLS